jgi:hypothetical protein
MRRRNAIGRWSIMVAEISSELLAFHRLRI